MDRSSAPVDAGFVITRAGAVCVGISLGLFAHGMTTTSAVVLDGAWSPALVASIWMAIMAVGLWIPILLARSWNRSTSSTHATEGPGVWVRRVRIGDELLLWPALGVIALLTGLIMAGKSFWSTPILALFDWLNSGFLLGVFPLAMIRLATICALLAVPAALCALSIACICRLAARHHNWESASIGLCATGCGAALLLAEKCYDLGIVASMMPALAGLPMLLLAVACVGRMGPTRQQEQPLPTGPEPVPIVARPTAHMARFSNLWLTASLALMMTQFARLVLDGPFLQPGHTFPWPALLISAGIGFVIGAAWRPANMPGMGGIGVAFAAAGVCLAGAIILPVLVWTLPLAGRAALAMILLSTGVTGYALAYAQRAIWCGVANRVRAGVDSLAATLAAGAIAVQASGAAWSDERGAFVCLSAVSLSLLALGGVSIIHETQYAVQTRRWQLVGVFAVLALLMASLPDAGRAWTRRVAADTAAPDDTWLAGNASAAAL